MTELADKIEALTRPDREFLLDVFNGGDVGPADRVADRARQKCRKLGWVAFNRSKWRWEITEKGGEVVAAIRERFWHDYRRAKEASNG